MLDLHTLEKVENWLKVRREQEKKQFAPVAGVAFNRTIEIKVKLLDHLLQEFSAKIEDIRYRIDLEGGGELGKLIKQKETKTKTDYICPTCHAKRSIIRNYLSDSHVKILRKIFRHCLDIKSNKIQTRDIKDLDHTDYCNIAQLQRFGFLYHIDGKENKKRDGRWGVAVGRIHDFLRGTWKVAEYSERDTVTKEQKVSEKRVTIHNIKRR